VNRNKVIIGALVALLLPYNVVYAASSKNDYDKEELENLTPGWSYSDKNKSNYKVTSDKNTFSTIQIEEDDDDDDEKEEQEIKFDQILTTSGPEVVSLSPSTGNRHDFWAMTTDGNWMLIENGSPVIGWKFVNGYWYYLDESGIMKTGWVNINGYWYYLYSNGIMASSTYIDGYYVGPNGAMR